MASATESTEHLMNKVHVEFDRAYHSGGFGSPFPPSNTPPWMSREEVVDGGRAMNQNWTPAIDVTDQGSDLLFRCELPGVHREHINVRLRGTRLVLFGKRELDTDGTETAIRKFANFSRAFSLPKGVTPEDVHADIGEGVLNVRVRKPSSLEAQQHKVEEHNEEEVESHPSDQPIVSAGTTANGGAAIVPPALKKKADLGLQAQSLPQSQETRNL